ncbi:hypothetical protein [Staphylococcus cohnii]|uniref:hypothetical protein n=1 Tax=Staphylococcus nepalensis TaxID=214473 RepID=UPI0018689D31
MTKLIVLLGKNSFLGEKLYKKIEKSENYDIIASSRNEDAILYLDFNVLQSIDSFVDFITVKIRNKSYEELVLINTISEYYRLNFHEFVGNYGSLNYSFFLLLDKLIQKLNIKMHFIGILSNLTNCYNINNFKYITEKIEMSSVLKQLAYTSVKEAVNFRVNMISPGYFHDMEDNFKANDYELLEDIIEVILYFCNSNCLNGQNFIIDRGDTIGY